MKNSKINKLNLQDKDEPDTRPFIDIPYLSIKTDEFRNRFPTYNDFYDFLSSRRAAMEASGDSFADQISNTVERCPAGCGNFVSMANMISIYYVEEKDAKSGDGLDDNFFGCPDCFLQHLDKHSNKVGRISL